MKNLIYAVTMISLLILLAACSANQQEEGLKLSNQSETESAESDTTDDQSTEYRADSSEPESQLTAAQNITEVPMYHADGNQAGRAMLSETEEGVEIALDLAGLKPGSKAIHIHETAKCEGPDFQSAGGHFNPSEQEHGLDNPDGSHAGDMKNITVSSKGLVNTTIENDRITLELGQENSLLGNGGTALMVHEGKDDMESDPSGSAGARVVCGEIN